MTKRRILLAAGVGLLATGLLAARGHTGTPSHAPTESPRLLPAAVVRPIPAESYERRRTFTGEVTARRSSQLGFEIAGRVLALEVDDGQQVAAGQALAHLDVDTLRADRKQIEAQRDEAQAVLDEMRAGPREQVIAAARHRSHDLAARADLLRRKQERRRKLLADAHVSREEFDETASAHTSTEALLAAARSVLAELEAGTRPERLRAQEARLAGLKARLHRIDVDIDNGVLVAPFAGRVAARHVDEGAVLAAGTAVFTLLESGHLEARIGVAPEVAAALVIGQTYPTRVGTTTYDARLRSALPTTDSVTRSRTVILDLPQEADGLALPGQLAELESSETIEVAAVWVPTQALVRGVRGLWSTFAAVPGPQGSVVTRHHVEVLHVEGERALVRGTLTNNDVVLVGDTSRVVPGQHVDPRLLTKTP